MTAIKSALFYPLFHGRLILRTVFWLGSGFLILAGFACVGIYMDSHSTDAIAAAVMFLCFGGAIMISALFYDDILQMLQPTAVRGPSRQD